MMTQPLSSTDSRRIRKACLLPPSGELGAKKRAKTMSTIKECDVALVVVDVARAAAAAKGEQRAWRGRGATGVEGRGAGCGQW